MSKLSDSERGQDLPELQGHAIGIVNTLPECDAVVGALDVAGFSEARTLVFLGDDGIQLVQRMLEGSRWGEASEKYLNECVAELTRGHCVVSVPVENTNEATAVAAIMTQFGGHGVNYFGSVVDTRLTS
jgi:hypothetical protein